MSLPTPELAPEMAARIRLVRRDVGTLLFHFTRGANGLTASDVLKKVIKSRELIGTDRWSKGTKCISFTEAPISEFMAIFSLVNIAPTIELRPRYEPYGIAVPKNWLFRHGGRPVIYGDESEIESFSDDHKYRFVPFNPDAGIDFTWEREWRIKTDSLPLDTHNALIVVPTASEAFHMMEESVADDDIGDGTTGSYDVAERWRIPALMAVSLDLFGVRFDDLPKNHLTNSSPINAPIGEGV